MLIRLHDTGSTPLNAVWVPGIGDSNGDRFEWSLSACFQVNVLPPAMLCSGNRSVCTLTGINVYVAYSLLDVRVLRTEEVGRH